MSLSDPNTTDLNQQTLHIAEDVVVWPIRERGKLVYRIEIPKLHKFYCVGYEEYVFLSFLDGNTTLAGACGLAARALGSRAPTSEQAGVIGRWLLEHELAYLKSDGPPVRSLTRAAGGEDQPKFWSRLNPFWMKFPLPGGDRWLRPIADKLTFCLAPGAVATGGLLILLAVIVLAVCWNSFSTSVAEVFSGSNWLWLLCTWVALKIVHELGHAVACHRQGGTVRETGMVFILFAPLAYVDVTSCWRMNSRWSRIAVSAAGMYVELVIAAIAILVWSVVDSPHTEFLLYNLVVTAGLSTLLFNANALMRFDGYFILADLVEIPNLYAEGSMAVRRILKKLIFGMASGESNLSTWRRPFVVAYGLAASFWRLTICLSLAIAASTMFAGAGIAIAGLGLFLWFGGPLKRLASLSQHLFRHDPGRFTRGMVVGGALAVSLWLLVWQIPIPTAVRAPAVAIYRPETTIRSRADGFIRQIHVRDSQAVHAGQLLIELENRDLEKQRKQLELLIEQNEIRIRQAAGEHDAGMRWVLEENRRALDQQLSQLRIQTDGLKVVAPRDGRVVARDLALKLGAYVREGDPLLLVASRSEKELVALVDQDSIEQVRPTLGQSVPIRLAGFRIDRGRLDRIDPRASELLPDPSLAATEGGPLEVRRSDQQEDDQQEEPYRLLTPHFRAHIELPENVAVRIPAGMRLTASLGYQSDTLAKRIKKFVRQLWYQAQDEAAQ